MIHQIYNSIGSHIYSGIVYEDYGFENNFHNSYEVIFVMEGEFTSIIHGRKIPLIKGDCLLISPNIMHDFRARTEKNKFFSGVFSLDFVSEFYKNGTNLPFYKFRPEDEVLAYLGKYMFYTGTPDLYIIKSCTYAICSQAIKLCDAEEKFDIESDFILAVNNYIFKNLKENFSRKDIADALNYEEHYFSKLFKINFNIGFNKYISLFRFEQACRLLLTTKLKITDIAYSCGFNSVRNLNRLFKEFSGKSPNEYRNSNLLITEPDVINMKINIPNDNEI